MKKNIMNLDESAKTQSKAIELVKRCLDRCIARKNQ